MNLYCQHFETILADEWRIYDADAALNDGESGAMFQHEVDCPLSYDNPGTQPGEDWSCTCVPRRDLVAVVDTEERARLFCSAPGMAAQIAELTAERDQLRAALQALMDDIDQDRVTPGYQHRLSAIQQARATLKATGEGG